jgi:hypothetical protein
MNRNRTKSNKPSHGIFHVTGDGKQARWTKIGAAWAHDDSSGMNLAFEYLPAGNQGRIVIRKAKDKADNQTQDGED